MEERHPPPGCEVDWAFEASTVLRWRTPRIASRISQRLSGW